MNILLVDHICHRQTKSFDFFRDLLSQHFRVDTFHYERHYRCRIPPEKVVWADVLVFLEFMPFRFRLGVPGKRCVFVPMYDNEWGSVGLWRRIALSGMSVVSFSRSVSGFARRCGVRNVLDVRYAVDTDRFAGKEGDPRVIALWERGAVTFRTVKRLFSPEDVDKVIVMRRPAENVAYEPVSPEDIAVYHVEIHESAFLPEEEYHKLLSEPGVYVAPRLKEGIGMSFLEQMAMGKCVVAHDDATMNEYIADGTNGILVDMRNPRHVSAAEIANVRANVRASMAELHSEWKKDMVRLVDFFRAMKEIVPLRSPWRARSLFWFLYYWIEGGAMRLARRCVKC